MKESLIFGIVCAVIVALLCTLIIVAGGVLSETIETRQVIYVVPCPDGACPKVTPFWVMPVPLGGD